MLKGTIKNIVSVSMALLVLFSTMSFTLSEHYCGEMLMHSSIFNKAASCGMEQAQQTPSNDCQVVKMNDCCKDVVIQHTPSEIKLDLNAPTFQQQVFVVALAFSFKQLFETPLKTAVVSNFYRPPILTSDIQVVHQTFLI